MLEEVFHRIKGEDGKYVVVEVRLPQVDVRDALRRCPHIYARTPDGFGAEPKPQKHLIDPAGVVGPTGGKPAMAGGVGIVSIVDVPEKVDPPAKLDPPTKKGS